MKTENKTQMIIRRGSFSRIFTVLSGSLLLNCIAIATPYEPQISQVRSLQEQVALIDMQAVRNYLEDCKAGFTDYEKLFDEFTGLAAQFPEIKRTAAKEEPDTKDIRLLREWTGRYRSLMLANPLLKDEKIIFSRYRLGDKARKAMGPELGTAPANYSSMFSGKREGFDAEISEISGLSGEIVMKTIYKPELDVPVSDMQLHWNGEKIPFTSLDRERKWQIYEVGTDGTGLKQMIVTEEPDLEFCDANYLPGGKIVVTCNIGYNGVPCVHGEDIVANLIAYDPADHSLRRLTFDQDGNWSPVVMPNGRLMYTRWEYTDLTHYFSRIVMHMNPDGTENKALYGSGSYFPNSTFDMKPLSKSSNRFIAIISGHHGVARSGRLIIFDPAKGRKEERGMIQEIPFKDRPIIPIIKDELVNDVWPQFMKPHPLNDHYFLVAAKLSPESLWGIYLVDVFDNVTLIMENEGEGLTSPILLKATGTPPAIPSKIKPGEKEATVFIQDIYEGEGSMGIPRGTIKSLRIFAYEYAYINSPSDHDAQGIQSGRDIKRVLGTVPVEEDGSALFKIPANTPVSIQPLDKHGAAVQWMRSWLTGMPGEIVSCTGCHEDQNTIPIPKRTIASMSEPRNLDIPEGGVRPFTFRLEIQPVLDRNCVSCHNGTGDIPDFRKDKMVLYERGRLTKIERLYDQSYLNLHPYVYRQGPEADIHVLKPYEYYANNSELIRMLEQGHHGVELDEKEWRKLYCWIDLNAPYFSAFTQINEWKGIDQVKRRRELSEKYSGVKVDWRQEIADYAEWLGKQPVESPVKQMRPEVKKVKQNLKKGFPFDNQTAKQKQSAASEIRRQIEIIPGLSINMVWIPSGTFPGGTVKKGFWMSETEITNEQFAALFPDHDSRYIGQTWKDHTTPGYAANLPTQPVVRVSHSEAEAFCDSLSRIHDVRIQLPDEIQWEWAARAGSGNDFWFGNAYADFGSFENLADSTLVDLAVTGVNPQPMKPDDPMRKYWDFQPKILTVNDGQLISAPVASYQPNPWGLYDMHGNVAEWTRSVSPTDTEKVIARGGSWIERPTYSTATARKYYYPWQKPFNVGFRIIMEE